LEKFVENANMINLLMNIIVIKLKRMVENLNVLNVIYLVITEKSSANVVNKSFSNKTKHFKSCLTNILSLKFNENIDILNINNN
jgi:hypothetical protein